MTTRSQVLSAIVIGTGFSGLGSAIRLKQAGFDFLVLERSDSVGGTWRDNHYPGAACDIESHLYSFSFELNPKWTRTFATQGEILAYLNHCADKYGIRPLIRFNTAAVKATWDERTATWEVVASDGSRYHARAIVSACGGITRPSLPDIPGAASFKGKTFHSARWDDDYALEGKSVAVIGTGASAIQIVPAIAPKVKKLSVFQRTAPWVIARNDHAIGERAQSVYDAFPATQKVVRGALYARHEAFALAFLGNQTVGKLGEFQGRKHLESQVRDIALRDKLTPKYPMGCKRVLISNDYYPALQRPNAELVTDGIASIVADGIITNGGKKYEVDAIVCATGFYVADFEAPFEVRGRRGAELSEVWRHTPEAYLGTTISGFPNLFVVFGPNTGLGHNSMVYMIESQIAYVIDALRTMKNERIATVEIKREAQRAFNEEMQTRLAKTIWATGCKSWYISASGRNTTLWPGFTFEFRKRTRKFDLAAYDATAESAVVAETQQAAVSSLS